MSNQILSATTQEEAVIKVQEISPPGSYVYCFGRASEGFDVGVYSTEEDFKADVHDGDGKNPRMKARHAVRVVSIPTEGETPFEEFQDVGS